MKEIIAVCMYGLMAVTLMTRCSKKAAVDSVELGEYKRVSYTPAPVEMTDERVEAEIRGLLDEYAVEMEVDCAVKEDGIASIDFIGIKDDVVFEGGTSSDYDLKLGPGSFIDGFEDGLIDTMKGQELSLNPMFPNSYPSNEEPVRQDVMFDVTTNAVKESKPAELNDASIKENTEPATIDKYRKVTRENLLTMAQTDADDWKKSEVFQKVMDSLGVIVANTTVNAYYNKQLSSYESQASQAGIDLETIVSYYGSDLDTLRSQLRAVSEEASRQDLVVEVIADTEGVAAVEEDKNVLATEFGYADKGNMIEMASDTIVNNYILTEKVVSFIVDNAVEAQNQFERYRGIL